VSKSNARGSSVTIHDVAKHAGVSSMTVSRVINGHKYVGEEVAQKVNASIQALNYSPNLAGRSLRASTTTRVGLLYSNPSASYLNGLLVGALEKTSATGAQLILEKCSGVKSQRAAVEKLIAAGADGIILPPPLGDSVEMLDSLYAKGVPTVTFASGMTVPGISSIHIDDYKGASAMTRHLISLGHTDIGFIKGDPQHAPARLRTEAFLATMAEAGLSVPRERVADGLFTYQSGLAAAAFLLKGQTRPTAIFSSNDDMAAAVIAVAHGLGLRVPEDVSVCGFDDTPVATIVWPALTTIHQPVSAMARDAVDILLEEVRLRRAGRPKAGVHRVVKYALIKRQSVAPLKSPKKRT
jgi:LacI family transcriptional regulator